MFMSQQPDIAAMSDAMSNREVSLVLVTLSPPLSLETDVLQCFGGRPIELGRPLVIPP